MIFAAILSASAFAYAVELDPMTDERTHLAQIGTEKGPSIVLFCSKTTGHKLRAAVNIGSRLYARPFSQFATYRSRVRFGDAEPTQFGFQYVEREAFLSEGDAKRFAEGLRQTPYVTVELYDYSNALVTVKYPTTGLADSLAKVEAQCRVDRQQ